MSDLHHEAPVDIPVEPDNPNNRVILVWTVAIVIGIIATCIVVGQIFGLSIRAEYRKKVMEAGGVELRELRAKETDMFTRAQWVSKKSGVVRIKLDDARMLTLRDWSARPAVLAAVPSDVPAKPAVVPTAAVSSSASASTSAVPSGSSMPSGSAMPSVSTVPATSASAIPSTSTSVKPG